MKERIEQFRKQMFRETVVIGVGVLAYAILKNHQHINELTDVIRKQNETLELMKKAIEHNTDQAYRATDIAMSSMLLLDKIKK